MTIEGRRRGRDESDNQGRRERTEIVEKLSEEGTQGTQGELEGRIQSVRIIGGFVT